MEFRGFLTHVRFGSDSGQGVINSYDGFGRLRVSSSNMGAVTRDVTTDYEPGINLKRLTHPDGNFFEYTYDTNDHLWYLAENGPSSTLVSILYDGFGRRSELDRDTNGATTAYGYDDISRLNALSQDLGGSATGYDVTATFDFNPASQIVTRGHTNNLYDYPITNSNQSYTVNGRNQYTQIAGDGAASLTWDANGNLTYDGATTFGYDTENRLVSASGAKNASLTYDPLGRLYKVTSAGVTTQFLYDGDRLIAEYNASGTVLRRYVHGAGVDEPLVWYEGSAVSAANRRYFHADHQGSIIAISLPSGGNWQVEAYDSYGIAKAGNSSRFQYTGQAAIPEVGLYYYKARFYDPKLGRFMQTDPIGYQDDLNLYTYVGNDPLNATDPTGKATYDYYPDGTISVDQQFDNHSQFSNSDIQSQASKFNGVTSDGHKLIVTFSPGTSKDSVKITTNKTLDDTGDNRSHTDKVNGRDVQVAPNAVGPITVGHEMGHTMGAGDQYEGGVDSSGNAVKENVPGSEGTVMRDYGGQPANQQTRDEIQRSSSQPNNTVRQCSSMEASSCH